MRQGGQGLKSPGPSFCAGHGVDGSPPGTDTGDGLSESEEARRCGRGGLMRLADRTAFVTGAAQGFGLAIAQIVGNLVNIVFLLHI